MLIEDVKIPFALQLCLDDVAWHYGADLRCIGQASRSGIPRYHQPEDYMVLEEIGRRLDIGSFARFALPIGIRIIYSEARSV